MDDFLDGELKTRDCERDSVDAEGELLWKDMGGFPTTPPPPKLVLLSFCSASLPPLSAIFSASPTLLLLPLPESPCVGQVEVEGCGGCAMPEGCKRATVESSLPKILLVLRTKWDGAEKIVILVPREMDFKPPIAPISKPADSTILGDPVMGVGATESVKEEWEGGCV